MSSLCSKILQAACLFLPYCLHLAKICDFILKAFSFILKTCSVACLLLVSLSDVKGNSMPCVPEEGAVHLY